MSIEGLMTPGLGTSDLKRSKVTKNLSYMCENRKQDIMV